MLSLDGDLLRPDDQIDLERRFTLVFGRESLVSATSGVVTWGPPGLQLTVTVRSDAPARVLRLCAGSTASAPEPGHPLVEIAIDGEGRVDRSVHAQHRFTAAGSRLVYQSHLADDHRMTITQLDPHSGLEIASVFDRTSGTAGLRCWTEVRNSGSEPVALDFVSSLALTGFGGLADDVSVHYGQNAWCAEGRWQELDLEQAGIVDIAPLGRVADTTLSQFAITGTGSWSSGGHLPMGALENRSAGQTWLWQIEHNGPTQWAVGDHEGGLFLLCSGPTAAEHQWRRRLAPGESFVSVPVAIVVSDHGLEHAFGELTRYRRSIRRANQDNEALPVIFNDYMNCLKGDPTEAALVPLIDAAAHVGAEYFVIDAGWHAGPKPWWDEVGAWRESSTRFPGGLARVIDRIRRAGMVPGLWLEPEVVGVRSPMASELPSEAFFQRNGRRLIEVSRYHLDLRHPAAREHLDTTVDRLVGDYGLGYFKFDYNINIGTGTDYAADSPGDGLLGHNRALLSWLDGLFERHPSLIIESCASGGMRADYAMLARLSVHSTSDQTDHRRYAPIAAAAPTFVTPEQAGIWAYPQPDLSPEDNAFTLVNALLGRVHLSGRVDLMDAQQQACVAQALEVYKSVRHRIRYALPRWPLGLPGWSDPWVALALEDDDGALLAVWRRDVGRGAGPDSIRLRLPWMAGRRAAADVRYPTDLPTEFDWDDADGALTVTLPQQPAGRLFEIRWHDALPSGRAGDS